MFTLANLVSKSVARSVPWEFRGKPPIEVRADKTARDTWINNPATRWNVYSLIEGLNESARVTGEGRSEVDSANPPYRMHGFVADYDADTAVEVVLKKCAEFSTPPQFIEHTLSGNWRLIWLFESPLIISNTKYLVHFLEKVLEHFPVNRLLAGFDKGAWSNPTRYYTNSGDWVPAPANARHIPSARVIGWNLQIAAKWNWVRGEGVEIPLEIVREKLLEKFPRFADWGDFSLRAMGPTFWVPDSLSPKSAIVRETGIQTFSAHATKGFYSWADLIGDAFVAEYRADSLGRAVESVYFDGKCYWRKLDSGIWVALDKADARDFLRITRGVSDRPDKKTGESDLDRAMEFIRGQQRIFGAGKVVFRPAGVLEINGLPMLNISSLRTLQPAIEYSEWGVNFPFVARFLDTIWTSKDQLPHFLGWLAIFYKSSYELKPVSGLNLFMAGGASSGKTFCNSRIIGGLMGGSGQAQDYLLGNDSFGAELFGLAHWMVDDAVFTLTFKSRQKFGEMVKKMNANRFHRYHEKFRMPSTVEWQGRIVTTCNDDPESIRAIPDLSGNIMDKIMILRTAARQMIEFPRQDEMNGVLTRELPHFARWLLAHHDEFHNDRARFGQTPHHEETLVLTSERSNYSSAFAEILENWTDDFFARHKDRDIWEGTAYQLHCEISVNETARVPLRSYDINAIGRQLAQLAKRGYPIEYDDSRGATRRWSIKRANHKTVSA